jgi:HEPN domain-containing protein
MRPRDDPEVASWLSILEDDLRVARLALQQDVPIVGPACFHAQQAAEKSLKALMVALDMEVPRSHDVLALVRLVSVRIPDADHLREPAAVVSAHGVSPRYPALVAPSGPDEARQALVCAERILTWVNAQFACVEPTPTRDPG